MPIRQPSLVRDSLGWKTVSSEPIYESPHLDLVLQKVLTPTRHSKPVPWTVVHRQPAIVVAPVTAAGNYVLVRQERIPVRATLWEFPAGQIDAQDAESETAIHDTAVRELREETGYELPADGSGALLPLGYFFTSQGFTDEHNHLFLARGVVLAEAGASRQDDEGILECREFSPAELRRMIAENEIVNANALSVYARLCARGLA